MGIIQDKTQSGSEVGGVLVSETFNTRTTGFVGEGWYQYYTQLIGSSVVKNLPANAGDAGLVPGSGRASGEGNGSSFQYPWLGNPMERGALWVTVHGVAEPDMT